MVDQVLLVVCFSFYFFFFKQKTAYEMRISYWSSDVCSSDLTSPGSSRPPLSARTTPTPSASGRWPAPRTPTPAWSAIDPPTTVEGPSTTVRCTWSTRTPTARPSLGSPVGSCPRSPQGSSSSPARRPPPWPGPPPASPLVVFVLRPSPSPSPI